MRSFSKSRFALRASALILALLLLLPSLLSCQSGLSANTKEVGKVGDYSVPYEEFYYLAQSYYDAVKKSYKDDPEGLKKEVWDYVNEKIVDTYMILSLCESNGFVYDEEALSDDVEEYISNIIASEYNGDEDAYYEDLEATYRTEHYTEFIIGIELLYARLADSYKEEGLIPNTDKKLVSYIKENFVHTCNIKIFVNPGDDKEAKRAKAEEALAKLESGEYDSLANMLGTLYNEDLSFPSSSYLGEYFPRGVMEKTFEDAAFALGVGEHSGIVEGKSNNMQGEYVDCFFIIERLRNEESEIENNLEAFSSDVTASVFAEKIDAIKDNFTFVPNEYAKSLNIHALDELEYSSLSGTLTLLIIGVVAIVIMVGIVLVIRKIKKKRFHAKLPAAKK